MHDQEPFFIDAVDSLKHYLGTNTSKPYKTNHWHHHQMPTIDSKFAQHLTPAQSLQYYIRSTEIPIICHSEKNSADIATLNDNMFIPCYYWWHGMVARDWFRHWERHADLSVINKSTAKTKFLMYSRDATGTRQYRKKVLNEIRDCSVQTSMPNAEAHMSATINVVDANTTAIHIVAETLFNTEKIYLTEKVFKPMVMSQPFILFAAPGSLQYLRDYGFKTFSSVWDEGYDLIKDPAQRLDATVALIRQLNNMSNRDFDLLYKQTLSIIEHNRKYFFGEHFQNTLWQELTCNVNAALDKQAALKETYPGGSDFYLYNMYYQLNNTLSPSAARYIQNTINYSVVSKEQVLQKYPLLKPYIT